MITNNASVKMVQNVLNGTTPLNMKGYLNSIPQGGIVMFDREINVPSIASGTWERMRGCFPYFAGGGC